MMMRFAQDPQFVNASGGDFHLQPNSPAKTAGSDGREVGAYGNGNACVGVDCGTSTTPPPPPPEPKDVICSVVNANYTLPPNFGSPFNFFATPIQRVLEAYYDGTFLETDKYRQGDILRLKLLSFQRVMV
jgi:hypothetical protein